MIALGLGGSWQDGSPLVLAVLLFATACSARTEAENMTCEDGVCRCNDGFADCDTEPGCEIAVGDEPGHCGGCGHVCASGVCDDGVCRCEEGRDECDGDPMTECEAVLADDPANCGRCGHDCLGGACSGGSCQPVTLATDLDPSSNVVVTPTSIIVSNRGIERMDRNGGARVRLVDQGTVECCDVAADDRQIFFSDATSLSAFDVETGRTREVYEGSVGDIAMTTTHVYAGTAEGILRWDRGSFDEETVDPGDYDASELREAGDRVYWRDNSSLRRSTSGGHEAVLTIEGSLRNFALGQSWIATCDGQRRLLRWSLDGMELGSGTIDNCGESALGVGQSAFFYSETGIRRWNGEDTPTELVSDVGNAWHSAAGHVIAADDEALYFLTLDELHRVRLPPSP